MNRQDLPRILCVDDEARIVEGLVPHLRKDYDVRTALSGAEGLRMLKEMGGAAVVISDMRMPEMDGATFLHHVLHFYPDATRMLLTGEPGRDAAIAAVNKAQIFRFLTKPCPPDQVKAAVEAGVMQHRMITAERTILKETLVGCINALVDVLAITNPVAFGRASRVKRLAMEFAASVGRSDFWQLEAAAMLSQLGYLSLPLDLVEKLYYGERLSPEEKILASGVPEVATKLLENIPRLEPVTEILAALNSSDAHMAQLGDGAIGVGARILALVMDYYTLVTQGHAMSVALQKLRVRSSRYGEELVEQLAKHLGEEEDSGQSSGVREVPLRAVLPGMQILQDVRTEMGTLLIPRGFEVTSAFLERIRHFGPDILNEKIKVAVPTPRPGAQEPQLERA
jgi:response regulator RpfG family c-di-GMP phosphodiesterase